MKKDNILLFSRLFVVLMKKVMPVFLTAVLILTSTEIRVLAKGLAFETETLAPVSRFNPISTAESDFDLRLGSAEMDLRGNFAEEAGRLYVIGKIARILENYGTHISSEELRRYLRRHLSDFTREQLSILSGIQKDEKSFTMPLSSESGQAGRLRFFREGEYAPGAHETTPRKIEGSVLMTLTESPLPVQNEELAERIQLSLPVAEKPREVLTAESLFQALSSGSKVPLKWQENVSAEDVIRLSVYLEEKTELGKGEIDYFLRRFFYTVIRDTQNITDEQLLKLLKDISLMDDTGETLKEHGTAYRNRYLLSQRLNEAEDMVSPERIDILLKEIFLVLEIEGVSESGMKAFEDLQERFITAFDFERDSSFVRRKEVGLKRALRKAFFSISGFRTRRWLKGLFLFMVLAGGYLFLPESIDTLYVALTGAGAVFPFIYPIMAAGITGPEFPSDFERWSGYDNRVSKTLIRLRHILSAGNFLKAYLNRKNISRLLNELSKGNTEEFFTKKVIVLGRPGLLVATRERSGVKHRIDLLNAQTKGVQEQFRLARDVEGWDLSLPVNDYAGRRIDAMVVYYDAEDDASIERLNNKLTKGTRSYRGDVSLSDLSRVGKMARKTSGSIESMDESRLPATDRELYERFYDSFQRIKEDVYSNEEKAQLEGPAFMDLEMTVLDNIFNVATKLERDDGSFKKMSPAEKVELFGANFENKENLINFALKRGPTLEEAREIISSKIDMIAREIKPSRGSVGGDTFPIMKEHYEQFWYYMLNPDGSFVEDTIEAETLDGKVLQDQQTPLVIFVEDLSPTAVEGLAKKYDIKALVTEKASLTAHWVVFAKQLGIPVAIIDLPEDKNFEDELEDVAGIIGQSDELLDHLVIVSSDSRGRGQILLKPDQPTVENFSGTAALQSALDHYLNALTDKRLDEYKNLPLGEESDQKVNLTANADSLQGIKNAIEERKAAGVGLLRSEYLFMDDNHLEPEREDITGNRPVARFLEDLAEGRDSTESREELVGKLAEFFRKISETAGRNPVKVRIMDFEDDKDSLVHNAIRQWNKENMPNERMPWGFEFNTHSIGREIAKVELEALMRAFLHGGENLQVFFPMISTVEQAEEVLTGSESVFAEAKQNVAISLSRELDMSPDQKKRVQKMIDSLKYMKKGIMIETDEAVKNIEALAQKKGIDFFSVGSNDLARFIMRREDGTPRSRYRRSDRPYLSRLQPKVLSAISEVMSALMKHSKGEKGLYICGEMASWYSFQVFMALLVKRIEFDTQKVPLSLSMAPKSIPFTALFFENLKKEDLKNVDEAAFFRQTEDDIGVVPADYVAGKVIERVFNRISHNEAFLKVFEQVKKDLEQYAEGRETVFQPGQSLYALTQLAEKGSKIKEIPMVDVRPARSFVNLRLLLNEEIKKISKIYPDVKVDVDLPPDLPKVEMGRVSLRRFVDLVLDLTLSAAESQENGHVRIKAAVEEGEEGRVISLSSEDNGKILQYKNENIEELIALSEQEKCDLTICSCIKTSDGGPKEKISLALPVKEPERKMPFEVAIDPVINSFAKITEIRQRASQIGGLSSEGEHREVVEDSFREYFSEWVNQMLEEPISEMGKTLFESRTHHAVLLPKYKAALELLDSRVEELRTFFEKAEFQEESVFLEFESLAGEEAKTTLEIEPWYYRRRLLSGENAQDNREVIDKALDGMEKAVKALRRLQDNLPFDENNVQALVDSMFSFKRLKAEQSSETGQVLVLGVSTAVFPETQWELSGLQRLLRELQTLPQGMLSGFSDVRICYGRTPEELAANIENIREESEVSVPLSNIAILGEKHQFEHTALKAYRTGDLTGKGAYFGKIKFPEKMSLEKADIDIIAFLAYFLQQIVRSPEDRDFLISLPDVQQFDLQKLNKKYRVRTEILANA